MCEDDVMPQPMTVVQQAFIDWCTAWTRFQIVDAMSISLVSHDVDSYNALVEDVGLGEYGYCDDYMVAVGRRLFPDAPGQPEGSGFGAAYDAVCTALDEWLAGPVMPLNQVSFPPDI
jgi:hypothetical protein